MTESTRTPRRNKTPLLVLTLIFAAIGIYWGVKHFGTWQYQESSENAYVNGHLVQISAQIPGRVSQILVDDNDTVQAGRCWRFWTTTTPCWHWKKRAAS